MAEMVQPEFENYFLNLKNKGLIEEKHYVLLKEFYINYDITLDQLIELYKYKKKINNELFDIEYEKCLQNKHKYKNFINN